MEAICGYSVMINQALWFRYPWRHNGEEIPECVVKNCSRNDSREVYTSPYAFVKSRSQCKDITTWLVKQVTLRIHSAQPEDVGQYSCSTVLIDSGRQEIYPAGTIYVGKGHTLYLLITDTVCTTPIVYTEFPKPSLSITAGSNHSINCSLQAPATATVLWRADRSGDIPITMGSSGCGREDEWGGRVFSTLTTRNGTVDGFLIFTVTIHICNTSVGRDDGYSCVVTDDVMTKEVKLSFSLTVEG